MATATRPHYDFRFDSMSALVRAHQKEAVES